MENYPKSISHLINEFSKLPSVGKRTATRYAYKIIEMQKSEVDKLINALKEVKENVKYCSICGNFAEDNECEFCKKRDDSIICVVKEPKDVYAMERTGSYRGAYHVLHGCISPLDNISPDDIRIKELLARITDETKEVVIALNPDVEGDATAMYIGRLIKPLGIKVSRLAHGIPVGQEIEFADDITLSRAMAERKEI